MVPGNSCLPTSRTGIICDDNLVRFFQSSGGMGKTHFHVENTRRVSIEPVDTVATAESAAVTTLCCARYPTIFLQKLDHVPEITLPSLDTLTKTYGNHFIRSTLLHVFEGIAFFPSPRRTYIHTPCTMNVREMSPFP